MPCEQPHHSHTWPTSGPLAIHFCENICGYCKTSSGALIGVPWANWWSLWEHVHSVHLNRQHGTDKEVELMGPARDELPEGILAPVSKERNDVRAQLRQALIAATARTPGNGNERTPIDLEKPTVASTTNSPLGPATSRLPFAPIVRTTSKKKKGSKEPQDESSAEKE
ncbi:hypothetical protein LTR78_004998 [Recurvomyces mirabilis]|uniref:Uncharacterized protein n=1 Tax=Recurvomyces mirabilis TaxID=574656 RepID=A0AAE0WNK6_9PEZI|nr:hypothetical protein LTR78_004998 [Recurvomyces mirabilis]KAK5158386.1 hypothetical protein LTS14_003404 [Recurvomyces mirabilis]